MLLWAVVAILASAVLCSVCMMLQPPRDTIQFQGGDRSKKRFHPHGADGASAVHKAPVTTFRFVESYGPMLAASFMEPGHLVIVEMPWIHAAKKLPDPVYRARFGT